MPPPEATATGAPLIIAIAGAESTGKTTLAEHLAKHLAKHLAEPFAAPAGLTCTWVAEYLREWCAQQGRTPRRDEQAAIAAEQARRIEAAATRHAIVVCDTTPLMTAVYHHTVFDDASLDAQAVAWQRRCALTLLTALDLPWQADGLQRDGPHVREPVDATIRSLLFAARLPFAVIHGLGPARLEAALAAACSVAGLRGLGPLPGT